MRNGAIQLQCLCIQTTTSDSRLRSARTALHAEHFGRYFRNAGVMFMCRKRRQGCGPGLSIHFLLATCIVNITDRYEPNTTLRHNRERKPLKMVNFALIQEPLIGLLRNTDSDLQRQTKRIEVSTDFREYRELTLLLIMLRSAANSYQALCFLLSGT